MPEPGTSLRAIRFELGDWDAYRHARTATVAIRTVGEDSAAAESHLDQLAIHIGVDQMRGCSNLRSRLAMFKIAAGIRRCCVKLQRRKGQLLEIGHVSW